MQRGFSMNDLMNWATSVSTEDGLGYIQLGKVDSANPKTQVFSLNARDFFKGISNIYTASQNCIRREELLITAIKNLLKRINFLELYQQLQAQEIVEDEFERQLELQANRYVIEMNNDFDGNDAKIIYSIVARIGTEIKDLSVSDVTELFSLNVNSDIPLMTFRQDD
jgi:hypothetical protein